MQRRKGETDEEEQASLSDSSESVDSTRRQGWTRWSPVNPIYVYGIILVLISNLALTTVIVWVHRRDAEIASQQLAAQQLAAEPVQLQPGPPVANMHQPLPLHTIPLHHGFAAMRSDGFGRMNPAQVRDLVRDAYRKMLGREADAKGMLVGACSDLRMLLPPSS